MKQQKIWMALVTDDDEVVFSCACPSERKAEKAIVAHLRKEQDFDGKDINEACLWIGDNNLRLNMMIFEMTPDDFKPVWDRLALFRSDLPLKDKGLYRVIYEIDVGADSAAEAAKTVHEIMTDRDSLPPVLDVIDNKGNKIRIDLSERKQKGYDHVKRSV
jgi:hypothetical protein